MHIFVYFTVHLCILVSVVGVDCSLGTCVCAYKLIWLM